MFDLGEVGARTSAAANGNPQVSFGVYLPHVTFPRGYAVKVRIIHERDQFVRDIPPVDVLLDWVDGSPFDLWRKTVELAPGAGSHFGQPGTYLYRFQVLHHGREVTRFFADPCGRASGIGTLSAFSVGEAPFTWTDAGFSVPEVDRLCVYELNVREFNRSFDGVVDQLDYIQALGVNALELMPISNVKEDVEWGYTPLGYFAPDERLGGPRGLRRMVDACHARGIAVIVDAVYAHAHPEFAYNLVYDSTGLPNPMMGHFVGEFFPDRPGTDYRRDFTRQYFAALNEYLLAEFHLDGFRYDYVPGFFDHPVGVGYADLVFRTYRHSQNIPRFQTSSGRSKILQCAEHLPDPTGVLSTTYSNLAWQNGTMDRARDMARHHYVSHHLAHALDPHLSGYPSEYHNPSTSETLPVAPLQYLETHDHGRFVNEWGLLPLRDLLGHPFGDRGRFYEVQPYVIGMYMGKGVPMIFNGQEFGENYSLPHDGIGRNLFERPLHWEYFYDDAGKALVRLFRRLGALRRSRRALDSRGAFFYFDDTSHRDRRVIAFRRWVDATNVEPAEQLVVVLNFSASAAEVEIDFPEPGAWREMLDESSPDLFVGGALRRSVNVPSHYGAIYQRV